MSTIKKSVLKEVISHIVKTILNEQSSMETDNIRGENDVDAEEPAQVDAANRASLTETMDYKTFSEVPVGTYFTIPGADDMYQKNDNTTAKNIGTGLLSKPTKLGKKTETTTIEPSMMISVNSYPSKVKEMSETGACAAVTGPNAFKKQKRPMQEMNLTGNVSGYNVPSAFSRKGGSDAGVKGSESLGYTLTPSGKKEMQRPADRKV